VEGRKEVRKERTKDGRNEGTNEEGRKEGRKKGRKEERKDILQGQRSHSQPLRTLNLQKCSDASHYENWLKSNEKGRGLSVGAGLATLMKEELSAECDVASHKSLRQTGSRVTAEVRAEL